MKPIHLVRFALVGLLMLFTSLAVAVTDQGDPNVTRLWGETGEGSVFVCSAAYIRDIRTNAVPDGFAWVLTAGHCAKVSDEAKRSIEGFRIARVNWQIVLESGAHGFQTVDFALGNAPDLRDNIGEADRGFWLGEKFPDGETVYVHGFPSGVERVVAAVSLPAPLYARVTEHDTVKYLIARHHDIEPGSSGSPVLNRTGRLVGVVWGIEHRIKGTPLEEYIKDGDDVIAVTPIERIRDTVLRFLPSDLRGATR